MRLLASQKKDKKKVIGEVFSEERLKVFLEESSETAFEGDPSYQILLKAYRGLPFEAFRMFVGLYHSAGHSLNPADSHGVPIQEMMAANVSHPGYVEALQGLS